LPTLDLEGRNPGLLERRYVGEDIQAHGSSKR
jgi:hypothetical protein